MRKMVCRLIWGLVAFLVSASVCAQQFNSEGMTYEVISEEPSEVMIYKAHRCVQDFKVPYWIKDYNGHSYRVTEIEHDAFRYLSCLYKLDLNGVETLRDGYAKRYEDGAMDYYGAFSNCSNLNAVNFGGLKNLGDYAFYGCRQLVEVNLTVVENIGKGAFRACRGLTEVTLGAQIKKVAKDAFAEVMDLSKIKVYAAVPPLCDSTSFSSETYECAVLLVPKGQMSAYRTAAGWSNFQKMAEMAETGIDEAVMDNVDWKWNNHQLQLSGIIPGEKVEVFRMDGQTVFVKVAVDSRLTVDLPEGLVYILKVGLRCFKIRN